MNIKKYERNGFQVLNITEDLGIQSSLSDLKTIIANLMEKGIKRVAVMFTPNSYLSSESISVLVQSLELMRENGARLVIIRPGEQIGEALRITGLTDMVDFVDSEAQLCADTTA